MIGGVRTQCGNFSIFLPLIPISLESLLKGLLAILLLKKDPKPNCNKLSKLSRRKIVRFPHSVVRNRGSVSPAGGDKRFY